MNVRMSDLRRRIWEARYLYLLLLPLVAFLIFFRYIPMLGLQIAFKKYSAKLGIWGSKWIGIANFQRIFISPDAIRAIKNTIIISLSRLVFEFPIPIALALLINELQNKHFKKLVQTISYLPHFITTVVMCSIILQMFDARTGLFNAIMQLFGVPARNYMGIESAFKHIYVWTNVWQGVGYSSIIYIAALSGISPELHEAAIVDGANILKRIWHVDLPGIAPTISILLIMSCGSILSVGYEKIYLLQNSLNLDVSEVISTYVYKQGIASSTPQYSYATAIGLFVSLVNVFMLLIVNKVSDRLSGSSLF